jgi:hypothetical protein
MNDESLFERNWEFEEEREMWAGFSRLGVFGINWRESQGLASFASYKGGLPYSTHTLRSFAFAINYHQKLSYPKFRKRASKTRRSEFKTTAWEWILTKILGMTLTMTLT